MAISVKQINSVVRDLGKNVFLSNRGKRLLRLLIEMIIHETRDGAKITVQELRDLAADRDFADALEYYARADLISDRQNLRLDLDPEVRLAIERNYVPVTALTLFHAFSNRDWVRRLYKVTSTAPTLMKILDKD
jgi:hypothetical protein